MHYALFVTLIFVQSIINGILDNIDHNKGAKALRDVWHAVKLFDRASLIGIGVAAFLVFQNWTWWKISSIPVLLIVAKQVWLYFYRNHRQFWHNLDETWKFTTGIPFLDRLCGFDK